MRTRLIVAARYRLHFKPALMRPADYEALMATMRAGFISQGKEVAGAGLVFLAGLIGYGVYAASK